MLLIQHLCSNPDNHIDLFPDITRIFHDMNKNNFEIAIVSNNGNKALYVTSRTSTSHLMLSRCDRALYLFNTPDRNAAMQPTNPKFIKYDKNSSGASWSQGRTSSDIDTESKSDMFKKIKESSRFDYSEMVTLCLRTQPAAC